MSNRQPQARDQKSKDFLFLHLQDLPYFRALVRAVESTFYQDLPMPAPVYDVGCGDGHFASLTFAQEIDVGLDPWHRPIHEARHRGAYRLLVEADGANAPFPDRYFASAFSNSVLEHIPHVGAVLAETARVLKPGAPLYFCVPNSRYLSELSISVMLGKRYTEWFRRMSRVVYADEPDIWCARLERAGFELVRWWHYFSPASMRALEWGHFAGIPSLIARLLTGRWIISRTRLNLALTDYLVRRYSSAEAITNGTFTFYVARARLR